MHDAWRGAARRGASGMKTLRILGLAATILAMIGGLYWWWQHGKTFPSTDDATLEANLLTIAPPVAAGRSLPSAMRPRSFGTPKAPLENPLSLAVT